MKVSHLTEKGNLWIHCPGCGISHQAVINGSRAWSWNGDEENPTLNPSLLVTGEFGGDPLRCHSFIREGRIEFLGDCTHALAGQTIPLPEWQGFEWFRPQLSTAKNV